MTVHIYFEDVNVGDEIPAWSRKTHFANWNRYAAVNEEFVPFHMDDEAGRAAKNEQGAFGMGNLRYAYIVNALRDWVGDEAEIREVGCQYRAINQKNDVLTVTGKVTEKKVENGENLVLPYTWRYATVSPMYKPMGYEMSYDSLIVRAADEVSGYYCSLAESVAANAMSNRVAFALHI